MLVNPLSAFTTGCVSVVIPAHNAAMTIRRTIASLVSERSVILECIVVDDGSVDETAAVVRSCAVEFDLPIVLRSIRCLDAGAARNHGLSQASGKWVYFLDADDVHEAGGLRTLVEAGEGPSAPELVLGSYFIQREGRARDRFGHRNEKLSPEQYLADRAVVIVMGCCIIRRDALDNLRFPDSLAYDEDTLFWAALLAGCRTAVVDVAVMTYNVSLQRSDDRLVHESRRSFERWRQSLLALESRGISRAALRQREAFMAIRVARIHMRRGELVEAGHFLTVAGKAPKTRADAYRWLRFRLKLALRRRFGRNVPT
jgi:glycosyltransferase involved in cell wall biosynthesis